MHRLASIIASALLLLLAGVAHANEPAGETVYFQGEGSVEYLIIAHGQGSKQYTYRGTIPSTRGMNNHRIPVHLPVGKASFVKVSTSSLQGPASATRLRQPDEGPNPIYGYGFVPFFGQFILSYIGSE